VPLQVTAGDQHPSTGAAMDRLARRPARDKRGRVGDGVRDQVGDDRPSRTGRCERVRRDLPMRSIGRLPETRGGLARGGLDGRLQVVLGKKAGVKNGIQSPAEGLEHRFTCATAIYPLGDLGDARPTSASGPGHAWRGTCRRG